MGFQPGPRKLSVIMGFRIKRMSVLNSSGSWVGEP